MGIQLHEKSPHLRITIQVITLHNEDYLPLSFELFNNLGILLLKNVILPFINPYKTHLPGVVVVKQVIFT